jgi:hypothetical protein
MSTRARVGVRQPGGLTAGVYIHNDGYPSYTGQTIREALRAEDWNIDQFVQQYVEEHRGGWSSFRARVCYCHPESGRGKEYYGESWTQRPPEWNGTLSWRDDDDPHLAGIEWLYLLNPSDQTLEVRGRNRLGQWETKATLPLGDAPWPTIA